MSLALYFFSVWVNTRASEVSTCVLQNICIKLNRDFSWKWHPAASFLLVAAFVLVWKCYFCQLHINIFFFPEGGGRSQSPRGGRASAHREGETLPERGAGAAGEEEGEEKKNPNIFRVQKVTLEFIPELMFKKHQQLTHWFLCLVCAAPWGDHEEDSEKRCRR